MFSRKPTAAQELTAALASLASIRLATAGGGFPNFTVIEAIDETIQTLLYRLTDVTL